MVTSSNQPGKLNQSALHSPPHFLLPAKTEQANPENRANKSPQHINRLPLSDPDDVWLNGSNAKS